MKVIIRAAGTAAVLSILVVPAEAAGGFSDVARRTFSGEAAVILQLLSLGLVSFIGENLMTALGRGNVASMIKVASGMVALLLIASLVWKLLATALGFAGY
ncbi:MAG: hypothetical protein RDU41_09945 [Clostridia bacterium]|nr:hypothetical protein [Clostridia bacterium]